MTDLRIIVLNPEIFSALKEKVDCCNNLDSKIWHSIFILTAATKFLVAANF